MSSGFVCVVMPMSTWLMRRRMDLRLPEELWERVAERAEELGQTRTRFVERALEAALAREAHGSHDSVAGREADRVRPS
jgi:predicted transcriptional regulator